MWLNSSVIDKFFRTFSVIPRAATDLQPPFPNRRRARPGTHSVVSQLEVDSLVKELIAAWRTGRAAHEAWRTLE